jgi:beta-N-acetylhexosaminidase
MSSETTGKSLEQRIGQVFMAGFSGTEPSDGILELIERHHLGGVILFSRNIASAAQALALTQQLQTAARAAGEPAPLLIATDQENGLVRRLGPDSTTFPGNMALGAIGSEQITFDVARATGEELRALGINMNLAPVVDVNNNPDNPVIGIRSFGEDPALVARLGTAAVRGYRAAGVISTLKHFPGHGDTAVDSHRALPSISATRVRLDAVELVPFRAGIAAGADIVMIGHIYLPALMGDTPTPTSLSPAVIGGLLREGLGFPGVVVTDCLEMDAVAETVGVARGAVLALQAGADLVMVSHRLDRQLAAIEAVRTAVESGELSAERIAEAAARVALLKQRTLAWSGLPTEDGLSVVGSEAHRRLRDAAYTQTTTVVRDTPGKLPLRLAAGQRLLIVASPTANITRASDVAFAGEALLEAVRQRHANVDAVTIAAPGAAGAAGAAGAVGAAGDIDEEVERALAAVRAADAVILVTFNAHLDRAQQAIMHRLAAAGRPTLGIAVCDPYDAAALPEVGTYLATYDYSPPALRAVAAVLFGQTPAAGHLPVTLPAAG